MKLIDTMKELGCDNYYIVELASDMEIDDCIEYYTAADDVDEVLYGCDVIDVDHVSKEFAVIYLDIDSLYEEEEELEEEDDDESFKEDVDAMIEAFRRLAKGCEDPITMSFASDPELGIFVINTAGRNVLFKFDEER